MKKIFFKKKTGRWTLQIADGHNRKDKNKNKNNFRKGWRYGKIWNCRYDKRNEDKNKSFEEKRKKEWRILWINTIVMKKINPYKEEKRREW